MTRMCRRKRRKRRKESKQLLGRNEGRIFVLSKKDFSAQPFEQRSKEVDSVAPIIKMVKV